MAATPDIEKRHRRRIRWRRFVPITVIAIGAAVAWTMAGDLLSLDSIRENRDALVRWREHNLGAAIAAYVGIYVVSVAFSVPGAVWLTLAGGFVFGTVLAAGLTIGSATIGATLVFLAARSSLGAVLHEKAGPWMGRIEAEVKQGAVSFMLVMRLIPVIPFFVANLAPAFVGVRLWTFVWTTLLGIAPATVVVSSAGAGLGEVLDRGGEPDVGVLFAPHVLGPLIGLAALSALPLIIRKLRRR